MLNLRYIFRLVGAFFSKFKVFIFLCIGMGFLIFFLLRFLIPTLNFKETLKIGEIGRYTVSDLPTPILRLISSGLTKVEADGSVVPDLAASWETTDKGKTWIFTLKDDIYWQDGEKVTSADINYQFSDVSAQRPDEKTVVFELENIYSAFPSVVSHPTFKSGLLGTGEWKVEDITLSGLYVEEIYLTSKEETNIVYKFYPTEESAKVAFELGEVDQINGLFTISPFDTWPKIKISQDQDIGEYVAVFFNTQDQNLSEKNLRQALTYAIDKEALSSNRAISPISKNSWAYNSQVKRYDYDAQRAKEMIDEYKSSSDSGSLTINLSTPLILLDHAEEIAKDWREVGVEVNVQVVSSLPTDYQAFLGIYDIPDDPDQYSIWHSTQTSTNITHYENVRIDKLLEDGRSELNIEARKALYIDFQRFLVEDSPAAFLYYPATYTVSRGK